MTNRAYTEAKVIGDINCSSSADHFIPVKLLHRGRWEKYDYYFEGGSFIGVRSFESGQSASSRPCCRAFVHRANCSFVRSTMRPCVS